MSSKRRTRKGCHRDPVQWVSLVGAPDVDCDPSKWSAHPFQGVLTGICSGGLCSRSNYVCKTKHRGNSSFSAVLRKLVALLVPSSKKMLILQDFYIFIFKENAFFLKKSCRNLSRYPVTRILVALPRSWKNMETHGRLTKTHGKT